MADTANQNPLERAAEIWRTRGTAELFRRAARRLGSAVLKANSAVWFGKQLCSTDSCAAAPSQDSRVPGEFAVVDPRELGGWLRKSSGLAWAADDRELEVAAECGHRWTTWALEGRTAAFCKVGGGRVFIVDFDRAFDLPVGVAYLSDVYVMSDVRRKGIGRALLAETVRFLGDASFAGVVCHIPSGNTVSANLFGSLGFVRLGEVSFTRILGMPLFSTRPERLLEKMRSSCGCPGQHAGAA